MHVVNIVKIQGHFFWKKVQCDIYGEKSFETTDIYQQRINIEVKITKHLENILTPPERSTFPFLFSCSGIKPKSSSQCNVTFINYNFLNINLQTTTHVFCLYIVSSIFKRRSKTVRPK